MTTLKNILYRGISELCSEWGVIPDSKEVDELFVEPVIADIKKLQLTVEETRKIINNHPINTNTTRGGVFGRIIGDIIDPETLNLLAQAIYEAQEWKKGEMK